MEHKGGEGCEVYKTLALISGTDIQLYFCDRTTGNRNEI